MELICQTIATGETDNSTYSGILGLWEMNRGLNNKKGTLFSAGTSTAPTSCTFVKNTVQNFPLLGHNSRDVMTIRLIFTGRASIRKLIIISAYNPCDSDKPHPLQKLWDVITRCSRNNLQLNIRCDVNAHHSVWGSTGINPRWHHLLE
jgi:hypothetical protein